MSNHVRQGSGRSLAALALSALFCLASAQAGCSDSQTDDRSSAEAGSNSEAGASNEAIGDAGSGASIPLEPDGFGAGGTSSTDDAEGGAGGEIDSVANLPIPIVSTSDPQSAWPYSLADWPLRRCTGEAQGGLVTVVDGLASAWQDGQLAQAERALQAGIER